MKKILVISFLLLTFAMLSIPVMAESPTKKDAAITVMPAGPPISDPGYPRFVSHGTISHSIGTSTPGATVTLTIQDVGTFTGDWDSVWRVNGNWKKASEGMGQWVISGIRTMTFPEGTFVGRNQRRITGSHPMTGTIEDHGVYRGISGMFTGWTLKLTNDEGYVIIPNKP